MPEKILIVEDEETLCASLKRVFSREGYDVTTSHTAEDGLRMLEDGLFDLVLTDIILPGIDGIELLRRVKDRNPEQTVVIMTAYASLETAVEALRGGAYDYVIKPVIHEEIKQIVRNALRQRELQAENQRLKKEVERSYDFSRIIGNSPPMLDILEKIRRVADARSNVLILGETGTGKELVARAVHFNSNRADKPFIPINCSAIPENLLESELFGYVRGAFTGAVASKKGLFEEAHRGTVFLDEIGDMGLGLQAKLLRVLEDQEIRPVGGTQSTKVDIRVICATHRDLESAVKEGCFRGDLFYRINVITLKLPPLRERREDIHLLVSYFIQKYSHEFGKVIRDVKEEALDHLRAYNWPGNIRELQNIIERSLLIADEGVIGEEQLPEGIRTEASFIHESLDEGLSIESYTKAFIKRFQKDNTEQQIADMLGITRKSLWEKRKKWGLNR
ncbi:MAG: sigma-54-dependent Fis family transcriptional regulator [Nitrospirales bacterium]|nr:sigma-54-dependent Fis family transcriptional regulator [Nitrospirales bacterium]